MLSLLRARRGATRVAFWRVIDWPLLGAAVLLSAFGLVTMYSFSDANAYFDHQLLWLAISLVIFLGASMADYRFLRQTVPVVALYGAVVAALLVVLVIGHVSNGAQSWFRLGTVAIQPADFTMLVLVIVLAKYFARRHIDIAQFRHVLISGLYAFIPFALIVLQPDLGSGIILASIWLGMVLVSGISKKHLFIVLAIGLVAALGMWQYGLHDYQKQRVLTFLHPLSDIQGSGYNAYQAVIAIGSGGLTGKGIGYGTQSKLKFLPEYQTDFIFAAFAEEWGLIGVLLMFALYGIIIWRVLALAYRGGSNFETLFAVGLACLFTSHFIVHVGINLGLLPVTGTTVPFMSYGGSHLVMEYLGLGMLMGMRRYARVTRPESIKEEFVPAPVL
ncbi:MAG TPA: rod shape-determining protein RodA [Candidatus Paceibacterota bacterium]|nr:rod shape-determining protein RodA [Candidatus Paceibacterota bacterium]